MPRPHDRLPCSAIVDRPKLTLPDGVRMAVWTVVNVEDRDIARAMPRSVLPPPMGEPLLPDVPNWAWHEYGMRITFRRNRDVLRQFGLTPTLAINGRVCRTCARVAEARCVPAGVHGARRRAAADASRRGPARRDPRRHRRDPRLRRRTAARRAAVSIPYTVEINDVAVFAIQLHDSDVFARRAIVQLTGSTPKARRSRA